MAAKFLVFTTTAILLVTLILSTGIYAKKIHDTSIGNNTGYGTPTKIIVDNATVDASGSAVRLSGTVDHNEFSVLLNDKERKLPVVMKKTNEAIVYRYKTHQNNKYIYYAESQGTLKNY